MEKGVHAALWGGLVGGSTGLLPELVRMVKVYGYSEVVAPLSLFNAGRLFDVSTADKQEFVLTDWKCDYGSPEYTWCTIKLGYLCLLSGLYQFNASITVRMTTKNTLEVAWLFLNKNTDVVQISYLTLCNDQVATLNLSLMSQLKEGDVVDMRIGTNKTSAIHPGSTAPIVSTFQCFKIN